MIVSRTVADVRAALAPGRDGWIGLVPTMGALHGGHEALLGAARRSCDTVVMSLFVNPAQFGDPTDLNGYPRDEGRDLEIARAAGIDVVFAPSAAELYPPGYQTWVEVTELGAILEGAHRPGHFRGVATICLKLFTIVRPDVAYFGQKDAQQVAVIRRMARDLDFPVRIEALPIVRERDGLAMSSRNAYLDDDDRVRATALSRALRRVEQDARSGSLAAGIEAGRSELAAAGIDPEYFEARDAEDLAPVAELDGRPVLVAVAAQVGGTRLIDNVVIEP